MTGSLVEGASQDQCAGEHQTDRDLDEALVELHMRMLERLGSGSPLSEVLTGIAVGLEAMMPGSRCAVLLLDNVENVLRCGAAPSVADAWRPYIECLVPGLRSGGCGTAVATGRAVVTVDVANDWRWTGEFREAALANGVRSCFSTPVVAGTGEIVGTFAIYQSEPHAPTDRQMRLVDRCNHLTAIAIDHARMYGALVASEERFRGAFDANVVGMALLNRDGSALQVNSRLCELAGRPERELLGRHFATMIDPADAAPFVEGLHRIAAGEVDGLQFHPRCLRAPDAPTAEGAVAGFPATVSVSGLHAGDSALLGFCLHVLDDTVRHAAEQERSARLEAEVARRTAESASRAKSWFLSGMSHELLTPLSAILGFAELLETLELTQERRDAALARIREATIHVISLVDDVLDLAKIEAGAVALVIEPVALPSLVREVLDLLEPLASERDLLTAAKLPASCPVVETDRRRLRQVLLNIVANAIKYNRRGGRVDVTGECRGGSVVLRVADEGPGFPEHRLPDCAREDPFTPFDRLGAECGDVPGSGLGLPLAKALLDALGGSLQVHGREDRGTVVEIRLPLRPGAPGGADPCVRDT